MFTQLAEIPFLSRRFVLSKYLGLEEDEIVENEEMWLEENPDKHDDAGMGTDDMMNAGSAGGIGTNELGAVGVQPPAEGGEELPPEGGEEGGPPPEGAPQ